MVSAVYAFTDKNPNAWIYATGSTKSRTRLYRIGLSKFLSEVEDDFEILGERKDDWESFKINIDYSGFLVRKKLKK